MPTLDPSLREQLATVIGKENADGGARLIAESGARAAIEALAVHLQVPHKHLDEAAKQLRNRLRARARQLGDGRHGDGRHEIGRLVEQAAYEHWHRMLFARFLAETNLLIHPTMKVAVTLEECAELAASEGAVDGWELAGRYASRMLPQIFRPDDPLLAVRFARDDLRKMEDLLENLPSEMFKASDSLGWCYQFWQARKKQQVNASKVKIGADELPAVTQLFTEPYMVQFLLHNTLGAWWIGLGRKLPVEMPYLRRVDDGTPAAGTFAGWPCRAGELKVLDPCCGSGHFLVAAFEILVAFRMAEDGLSAREACDAVLRDNLFGLEIDARCVQIAAFALAMAAWTYPGSGGYRPLAAMSVACSGLAISGKKEEWERLGGGNARLRAGMGHMWELFRDAPVLGSLIDPNLALPDPLFAADFGELGPALRSAVAAEEGRDATHNHEVSVAAQGTATAAALLAQKYTLVTTNPPYLLKGKQSKRLRAWCSGYFEAGAGDLATVFLERCRAFCVVGGCHATVTPQNWLFLGSYTELRRALLSEQMLVHATKVGSGATATASWDVIRALTIVVEDRSKQYAVTGLEATESTEAGRAEGLRLGRVLISDNERQLKNPDHRIGLAASASGPLLLAYADSLQGISTGDSARFVRQFWEIPEFGERWAPLQSTVSNTTPYGGKENVVLWESGAGRMVNSGSSAIRGLSAQSKMGVSVTQMRRLPATIFCGSLFDTNAAAIVPRDPAHLPAVWAFCSSESFSEAVRQVDQKLGVTNASLAKVPFDLAHWSREAQSRFPSGLPPVYSSDPTQWLFRGAVRSSDHPLQVAVSRLLGFQWGNQDDDGAAAHADADGIVCVPALRGERPAAERLTDLLAAAWGRDWHPQTLTNLLGAVGHKGTLEEWLRDLYFKQHCELFSQRPFVWHVWDGHREGFSALVNYHKLDHERLKSLTWAYLGDWIRSQELDAKAGKSGAGDRLGRAKTLQRRLADILEGQAPLDIFVRWKPLAEQPLGWHPDLDDGVRVNIRPFLTGASMGSKGAGVLRWKPTIKWGMDRGKNPPGLPWGSAGINDLHLSLSEKRVARGEK